MAQELLVKLGVPLAAPSANKFGRTSPTRAEHVEQEFRSAEIPIVDGGPCSVGLESTVVLIENKNELAILREGVISLSEIESHLKRKKFEYLLLQKIDSEKSPGHLKHHYMPAIPLIYILGRQPITQSMTQLWSAEFKKLDSHVEGVRLLKPRKIESWTELRLSDNAVLAARELYNSMRESASSRKDVILFFEEPHMQTEAWIPILNRLQKAASMKF